MYSSPLLGGRDPLKAVSPGFFLKKFAGSAPASPEREVSGTLLDQFEVKDASGYSPSGKYHTAR